MDDYERLQDSVKKLSRDLRAFIELSVQNADGSWNEWLTAMARQTADARCWESKCCDEKECPAYMNSCGRCWLIAGTMCGGKVQGKYAQKYETCCECDVYQGAVFKDTMGEVYEHVLTLVHSLKSKQDELKHLATRDLLTGLFNRNYFNISIEREMEKIKREGARPLFVMIDVNNFKYVNDTHGHLYGDKVLREAAGILGSATRASDLLVRFGGDEFLILLPSFSQGEEEALVERINAEAAEWNASGNGTDYKLSFSIGHSAMEPGEQLDECLARADGRMYEQKAASASQSTGL